MYALEASLVLEVVSVYSLTQAACEVSTLKSEYAFCPVIVMSVVVPAPILPVELETTYLAVPAIPVSPEPSPDNEVASILPVILISPAPDISFPFNIRSPPNLEMYLVQQWLEQLQQAYMLKNQQFHLPSRIPLKYHQPLQTSDR